MKKRAFLVLILSMLCLLLFGCANDQSRIIGKWKAVNQTNYSDFLDSFELCDDGVILADDMNGSYTLSDGKFTLTILWAGYSYDYKLEGSTLTLSRGNKTVTYKRQ
jgi:hypothetical protein